MLRDVKAIHHRSGNSPIPYWCEITRAGFLCGRCNQPQTLGISAPTGCNRCGAQFEYTFEAERNPVGLGCAAPGTLFFANAQDPVQRLEPPDAPLSRREIRYQAIRSALHSLDLGIASLRNDIGPTTACFDCGAIIPIGDCFYSSTIDQRALCEGCYEKAEKAGRAKCRT